MVKYPIYGKLELKNGTQTCWLEYVEANTLEIAANEAVRIVSEKWKDAVKRCYDIDTLSMYLKYVGSYLDLGQTLETFAAHHVLSADEAKDVLRLGKQRHDQLLADIDYTIGT